MGIEISRTQCQHCQTSTTSLLKSNYNENQFGQPTIKSGQYDEHYYTTRFNKDGKTDVVSDTSSEKNASYCSNYSQNRSGKRMILEQEAVNSCASRQCGRKKSITQNYLYNARKRKANHLITLLNKFKKKTILTNLDETDKFSKQVVYTENCINDEDKSSSFLDHEKHLFKRERKYNQKYSLNSRNSISNEGLYQSVYVKQNWINSSSSVVEEFEKISQTYGLCLDSISGSNNNTPDEHPANCFNTTNGNMINCSSVKRIVTDSNYNNGWYVQDVISKMYKTKVKEYLKKYSSGKKSGFWTNGILRRCNSCFQIKGERNLELKSLMLKTNFTSFNNFTIPGDQYYSNQNNLLLEDDLKNLTKDFIDADRLYNPDPLMILMMNSILQNSTINDPHESGITNCNCETNKQLLKMMGLNNTQTFITGGSKADDFNSLSTSPYDTPVGSNLNSVKSDNAPCSFSMISNIINLDESAVFDSSSSYDSPVDSFTSVGKLSHKMDAILNGICTCPNIDNRISTNSENSLSKNELVIKTILDSIKEKIDNNDDTNTESNQNENITTVTENSDKEIQPEPVELPSSPHQPQDKPVESKNVEFKKKDPETIKKNVPETIKKNFPDTVKKNVPKTFKKNVPEIIKKNVPDTIKTNVPETLKTKVPQTIKQNVPDTIKKNVPNTVKKNVPNTIKKNVPNTIKKNVPNTIKKNVSEAIKTKKTAVEKVEMFGIIDENRLYKDSLQREREMAERCVRPTNQMCNVYCQNVQSSSCVKPICTPIENVCVDRYIVTSPCQPPYSKPCCSKITEQQQQPCQNNRPHCFKPCQVSKPICIKINSTEHQQHPCKCNRTNLFTPYPVSKPVCLKINPREQQEPCKSNWQNICMTSADSKPVCSNIGEQQPYNNNCIITSGNSSAIEQSSTEKFTKHIYSTNITNTSYNKEDSNLPTLTLTNSRILTINSPFVDQCSDHKPTIDNDDCEIDENNTVICSSNLIDKNFPSVKNGITQISSNNADYESKQNPEMNSCVNLVEKSTISPISLGVSELVENKFQNNETVHKVHNQNDKCLSSNSKHSAVDCVTTLVNSEVNYLLDEKPNELTKAIEKNNLLPFESTKELIKHNSKKVLDKAEKKSDKIIAKNIENSAVKDSLQVSFVNKGMRKLSQKTISNNTKDKLRHSKHSSDNNNKVHQAPKSAVLINRTNNDGATRVNNLNKNKQNKKDRSYFQITKPRSNNKTYNINYQPVHHLHKCKNTSCEELNKVRFKQKII